MSAFSLVGAPQLVTLLLQRPYNAPLPIERDESRTIPELRYTAYRQSFSARDRSMSQLLRTV
jgi:hypothetical protein